MDYRISNVRTDVNACNSTRGCKDIVIESALKVDSGRKIPWRTGEPNLRQRCDGPPLYQWATYPPTLRLCLRLSLCLCLCLSVCLSLSLSLYIGQQFQRLYSYRLVEEMLLTEREETGVTGIVLIAMNERESFSCRGYQKEGIKMYIYIYVAHKKILTKWCTFTAPRAHKRSHKPLPHP